MLPHIFVSVTREDRELAHRIVQQLEAAGLRCWMADRDIEPGAGYPAAIGRAVTASGALVLLLTESANHSPHVLREVESAFKAGKPIVSIRFSGTMPSADLQYFLSKTQWVDAVAPPIDSLELVRLVQRVLETVRPPDLSPASPKWGPRIGRANRRHEETTSRRRAKDRLKVWFGTNRKRLERAGRVVGFTSERDTTTHFAWCRVAVPESHKIGSVGSPWWKRLLTWKDDRLKLVKLQTVSTNQYWVQVARALTRASPGNRDAVVFLHGYNVSFEQAALRAAQLGFDLGISGLMAFYSWPSKGTLRGYTADEATIEASEGFIADYLTAMAAQSGAEKVHIIAHSMGNRGLVRAIDRIATTAADRTNVPFNQVILAAADVDQDTFKRLGLAYQKVAARTTMYVCSRDRAVEASHWLHDFPRAGITPPVLVVPGIDTVNVSNVDLTLLGHGYVAEARDVLHDIHRLITEGSPPERRFGLQEVTSRTGERFWVIGA